MRYREKEEKSVKKEKKGKRRVVINANQNEKDLKMYIVQSSESVQKEGTNDEEERIETGVTIKNAPE